MAPSPSRTRAQSLSKPSPKRSVPNPLETAAAQPAAAVAAVPHTPPKKRASSSSVALLKRASSSASAFAIEIPTDTAGELCVGGCKGSPGADGLSAADWLLTLSAERREVEAVWLEKLSAEEFRVLRMKGTEEINTGEYNELMEPGIYVCAGCAQPLYSSKHKFKSGHGWPAFCDNLPGALTRNGTRKVEIVCSGCQGHIGHVFKSSRYPPPKRERHCANSVSLRFLPGAPTEWPIVD